MKKLFIIILACWLSACGFHLRGTTQPTVKFKKVYLEGASGDFLDQFKEVLNMSSARIAKNAKESDLHVKVLRETFRSRAVSLNFSGRGNEFEFNYLLEYQLFGANNAGLPSSKPIQIIREYFNDQQDILAKNNEANVIRKEMYQQAVLTLLERAKAQVQASAK